MADTRDFKNHDPKENPTAFSQGKDPRFPQVKQETLGIPKNDPPATPPPLPTPEQVQARIDAEALEARNKAKADGKANSERKVSVKLLNDVWISDPTHDDAGPDGIRRIKTNIPVLDAEGNPKVDPKTKAPVTTHTVVDLPLSAAKMMIEAGKAERMDPL